jgi:hypothetical protein
MMHGSPEVRPPAGSQVVTVMVDASPPALCASATAPAAVPTTMLSAALTDECPQA